MTNGDTDKTIEDMIEDSVITPEQEKVETYTKLLNRFDTYLNTVNLCPGVVDITAGGEKHLKESLEELVNIYRELELTIAPSSELNEKYSASKMLVNIYLSKEYSLLNQAIQDYIQQHIHSTLDDLDTWSIDFTNFNTKYLFLNKLLMDLPLVTTDERKEVEASLDELSNTVKQILDKEHAIYKENLLELNEQSNQLIATRALCNTWFDFQLFIEQFKAFNTLHTRLIKDCRILTENIKTTEIESPMDKTNIESSFNSLVEDAMVRAIDNDKKAELAESLERRWLKTFNGNLTLNIDIYNQRLELLENLENLENIENSPITSEVGTKVKETINKLIFEIAHHEKMLQRGEIVEGLYDELNKYYDEYKEMLKLSCFKISEDRVDYIKTLKSELVEFIRDESKAESIQNDILLSKDRFPGVHLKSLLNRVYIALAEKPEPGNNDLYMLPMTNQIYHDDFMYLIEALARHKNTTVASKKIVLNDLLRDLMNTYDAFAQKERPTLKDLTTFRNTFTVLLHTKDDTLGIHTDTGIMRALFNIVASLATLIRLAYTKFYSEEKRARLFFDKTESVSLIDEIDDAFNEMLDHVTVQAS